MLSISQFEEGVAKEGLIWKQRFLLALTKINKRETGKIFCVECGIVQYRKLDIKTEWEESLEAFEMWIWIRRACEIDRQNKKGGCVKVGEGWILLNLIREEGTGWDTS